MINKDSVRVCATFELESFSKGRDLFLPTNTVLACKTRYIYTELDGYPQRTCVRNLTLRYSSSSYSLLRLFSWILQFQLFTLESFLFDTPDYIKNVGKVGSVQPSFPQFLLEPYRSLRLNSETLTAFICTVSEMFNRIFNRNFLLCLLRSIHNCYTELLFSFCQVLRSGRI